MCRRPGRCDGRSLFGYDELVRVSTIAGRLARRSGTPRSEATPRRPGLAPRPARRAMSAGIAPDAATAAGWGDRPPRRMRLISWRPVRSGKLLGFASVELGIGLRLFEWPVFAGTNGPWAALPRKARLDREKRQRLGAN